MNSTVTTATSTTTTAGKNENGKLFLKKYSNLPISFDY